MLLANKNAVIYGAGGAIGGAVARAFAREGVRVFLTARNLALVAAVAKEIVAAGGAAETAQGMTHRRRSTTPAGVGECGSLRGLRSGHCDDRTVVNLTGGITVD